MAKSKIFLVLSLSLILGIFARSFWSVDLSFIYFLVIAPIIAVTIFYRNKYVLIAGFAVLFFVGGIFLTEKKLSELDNLELAGQNYSGEALIAKEPASSGNYQKIVAEIKLGSRTSKPRKVLVNANIYPEYFYGDKIKLDCNLALPEKLEDFDYPMYLAKDGIYYVCQKAKMEKIASGQGSKFYGGLLKLKNKFNGSINHLIPFPEAGLLSGLILGGSGGLTKELQNNFSRTGMTHVVAVSGYNVTIVAEYLMLLGIFLGLWRKQAFWFAVLGILLFVLMTGLTASAVRAGVMGMLLLWAMKNGRLANAQNAVIFAAAVMLFWNPMLLRWDIGFQLSFLATLGIVYLYPHFEEMLNKKSKLFWLWEIMFLSLSAQIFVYPIIFYNFHNLSLISLLANILILPIIPLTMLAGFLMAVANFVFVPLATVLAWLAYLPLKYEVAVINILGAWKFSALEIKNFPWWGVAVWYIILVSLLFLSARKSNKKLPNQLSLAVKESCKETLEQAKF